MRFTHHFRSENPFAFGLRGSVQPAAFRAVDDTVHTWLCSAGRLAVVPAMCRYLLRCTFWLLVQGSEDRIPNRTEKDTMRSMYVLRTVTGILGAAAMLWSQAAPTTAIRAGKLFDPKSGQMLANQVVLIQGERIMGVGPAASVPIPAGAKLIDLSRATVLPGLIDGHLHLTDAAGGLQHQMIVALHSATESLKAGYTTQVVQGTHGSGFADVELKRAIEQGLVQGPRLLPAGPILAITAPGAGPYPLEVKPSEVEIVKDGPDALRAGVRELAHYGADHVKIHTTGAFYFKPNGEMVNQALPSLEELKAVVDEAHRRGMFVASHTYGGDGLKWAIEAGVDDIQHATAATVWNSAHPAEDVDYLIAVFRGAGRDTKSVGHLSTGIRN